MSNHFRILEAIANSYPITKFNTTVNQAAASTNIEIDGHTYKYLLKDWDYDAFFAVTSDRIEVKRIYFASHESLMDFSKRIKSLISQYK